MDFLKILNLDVFEKLPRILEMQFVDTGFMTMELATEITGNLSEPSKMPCYSYNLPASACLTGGKLHEVENSVCNQCYAFRGNYGFPHVKNALKKRLDSITHPRWVEAITFLINAKEKSGYFRFHDSGDLQNKEHLQRICKVADNLPHIKFWLPTREYSVVREFIKSKNRVPKNLTIRLSAFMIDGPLPVALAKELNLTASGVSRKQFTCPASSQGNVCGECRLCWESPMPIIYKKH